MAADFVMNILNLLCLEVAEDLPKYSLDMIIMSLFLWFRRSCDFFLNFGSPPPLLGLYKVYLKFGLGDPTMLKFYNQTYFILHLQRLHAKAIFPPSTIYVILEI